MSGPATDNDLERRLVEIRDRLDVLVKLQAAIAYAAIESAPHDIALAPVRATLDRALRATESVGYPEGWWK